jgi:hypothetical protein
MNRLHGMTAAIEVGFSRSERMASTDETTTTPAATDGDSCATGTASFALITYFKANRAQVAAIAAAAASTTPATAAAGTAPEAAPGAATTTPATPAAGTVTPATGTAAPSSQTASAPTAGAK